MDHALRRDNDLFALARKKNTGRRCGGTHDYLYVGTAAPDDNRDTRNRPGANCRSFIVLERDQSRYAKL